MHSLQVPIYPSGALVDVLIGFAAADIQERRRRGQPVPAPSPARALIDPGAEISCVDSHVLAPLVAHGLLPERYVFANLPFAGGTAPAPLYLIAMALVHPSGNQRANLILRSLPVLEQPLNQLGYEALLGRDVLAR